MVCADYKSSQLKLPLSGFEPGEFGDAIRRLQEVYHPNQEKERARFSVPSLLSFIILP
jgi:hypothetical protein